LIKNRGFDSPSILLGHQSPGFDLEVVVKGFCPPINIFVGHFQEPKRVILELDGLRLYIASKLWILSPLEVAYPGFLDGWHASIFRGLLISTILSPLTLLAIRFLRP